MTDKIKIFIEQNRHAFDGAIPGAHAWEGVAQTLERLQTADGIERAILLDRVLLDTELPKASVWATIEKALDAPPSAGLDDLESFIRDNRACFDVEAPDLRVWAAIESAVPASKKAKVVGMGFGRHLMRIAAAVGLLLAGVGLGVWYAGTQQAPNMAMGEVSGEYQEVEQYYQRDIAGKQQKLASFVGYQPAEVDEDLKQLDQIMAELRQELANVPPGNREQVVRAMIENYKAKASILERVLERLEVSKPDKTNSNQQYETDNI